MPWSRVSNSWKESPANTTVFSWLLSPALLLVLMTLMLSQVSSQVFLGPENSRPRRVPWSHQDHQLPKITQQIRCRVRTSPHSSDFQSPPTYTNPFTGLVLVFCKIYWHRVCHIPLSITLCHRCFISNRWGYWGHWGWRDSPKFTQMGNWQPSVWRKSWI